MTSDVIPSPVMGTLIPIVPEVFLFLLCCFFNSCPVKIHTLRLVAASHLSSSLWFPLYLSPGNGSVAETGRSDLWRPTGPGLRPPGVPNASLWPLLFPRMGYMRRPGWACTGLGQEHFRVFHQAAGTRGLSPLSFGLALPLV